MNKGILGNTVAVAAMASMTISHEDMVLADEAFIEASELAHESETEYGAMEQALVVSGKLEQQEALATELMSKPELVNTATVAMARESMDLALAALGGTSSEFHVSTEAMQTAPLQAMEVTHEGIKDVAKKIYESIKMVFKKIALTIKKLAAKLIVAVDGTGKSAEKMLKALKADKSGKIASKFDEKVAERLVRNTGGYQALIAGGSADVISDLTTNLVAVTKFTEAVLADHATLVKAASTADGDNTLLVALKNGTYASPKYSTAKEMAGSNSADGVKSAIEKIDNIIKMTLTPDQETELNLDGDVVANVFVPTYFKGNTIHGVVFYANKLEGDDLTNVAALLGAFNYKNATVTGLTDTEINTHASSLKPATTSEIEDLLGELKSASKTLKSFSDARMKDIDKVMKDIEKAAKDDTGIAMLNRISGSEFNKVRMFVAGNYIASVFAMAKHYRTILAVAAIHIKQYDKTIG